MSSSPNNDAASAGATAPDLHDPVALARLGRYTLAARLVVDGLFSGRHKSPRKGFSVEFAEHKPYTPGVDPKHLDWKLLARRERLYVKQYDEQTNLRGVVLLDSSASMGFAHSGPMTKHQYASCCAAALCHLMQRQQDAFGLTTFGKAIHDDIAPRQGAAHLARIGEALEQREPTGDMSLSDAVDHLARRLRRRSLIIVLSDFLGDGADAKTLADSLGMLRHRKHELIALQILDPAELTFPFRDVGRIEDTETGRVVEADPQAIADHYRAAMQRHVDTLRRSCLNASMGYALGQTSQTFDDFLAGMLARRES